MPQERREDEQRREDDERANVEMQRLAADLFEVAGGMRRDGEAIARTAGQTQVRWQVLWIAASGQLTVPSIARRLGTSRQNVQRIAHEIVADGLATFESNPDHSRSPLLVLTRRGSATLDRLNQTARRRNLELTRELGDAQVRRLRALLDRLRRALQTPSK
jgi:DNA-binding MarR family transcriptional regulator